MLENQPPWVENYYRGRFERTDFNNNEIIQLYIIFDAETMIGDKYQLYIVISGDQAQQYESR